MKSLEELKSHYEAEIKSQMLEMAQAIEDAKPHIWRRIRWYMLAWVGSLIGAVVTVSNVPAAPPYLPALAQIWWIPIIGIAIYHGAKYASKLAAINVRLRNEVVVPAIRDMVPEMAYDKNGYVPESAVREGGLFNRLENFRGEDLFTGKLGQTEIAFSEIMVDYRVTVTTRDSKGNSSTRTETRTMGGLYMVVDFNKSFNGRTLVLPDFMEKMLGGTIGGIADKALTHFKNRARAQHNRHGHMNATGHLVFADPDQDSGLKLIRMEDPEFEEMFKVYTTDQMEAFYILSTSLMARLTAFVKDVGANIRFGFSKSNLHLFVPGTAGAMFEITTGDDLTSFDPFHLIHQQLDTALGVVEDLNLNTRIWGDKAVEAASE